jgi:hypothetical protein
MPDRNDLSELLGRDAPDLSMLDDHEIDRLCILIDAADKASDRLSEEGLNTVMEVLPRILRGPARTILFGRAR